MRTMMWIYLVILFFSEARSMDSGWTGANSTVPTTTNSSLSVHRYDVFGNGNDVNLTCSDKMWNETFYVIWKIKLKNKHCEIKFSTDGQNLDSCNDGKSLRNTSSAQPYLHIPKFSEADVGVYKCEFAFKGAAAHCEINVGFAVLPTVDAWLEHKNNTTVAVCAAKRGNPAVNISWSHTGSFPEQTLTKINGLFTVESRLELPEGMDLNNLSCIISQQNWNTILFPKFQRGKEPNVPWLWILIAVMTVVFLVGFLLLVFKKLRPYQQSDSAPSKSPPLEDVEEVEPYASYVQRVNSIYN